MNPLEEQPLQIKRRRLPRILMGGAAVIVVGLLVSVSWWVLNTRPVDSGDTTPQTVKIESGSTLATIAAQLKEDRLIRSELAFTLYARLTGVRDGLKSGIYVFNPSQPLADIVTQLGKGSAQTLTITFFPGATLRDPTDIPDAKRTDVVTVLKRAGYATDEIDAALAKTYDHPLFADKPAGTSLEGYIWGETYQFALGTPVEEILERTFDIYYREIIANNILNGAQRRGLSLYEAITLASIVEREVSGQDDQRQVAQVFYKRLATDMPLGSDVTFIYAADQDNQPRAINYPSPYNTRVNPGLPPGPIATPGIDALRAVADPATGDYLYFVAGDDGKTYFAKTNAQHEENVRKHCVDLCSEL